VLFTELQVTTNNGSGLGLLRVVAIGGDSIKTVGGSLARNGQVFLESYLDPSCKSGTQGLAPTTVPSGDVFLLGDNRCDSKDSRSFGVVSLHAIVGKAVGVNPPPG